MPDTTMIRAARDARRTVRITYVRSTDIHRVDTVCGDEVITEHARIDGQGYGSEAFAERIAAGLARATGLDVSRVDVS